MAVIDHEIDLKGGLAFGLIPAWKALAGMGGLELGGDQLVLPAAVVGEAADVGPDELLVEGAGKPEMDLEIAGGHRLIETQREAFALLVDGRFALDATAAVLDHGRGDRQVLAVEHDLVGGLGCRGRDRDRAGEGLGLQIGFQPQAVGGGTNGGWQPVAIG